MKLLYRLLLGLLLILLICCVEKENNYEFTQPEIEIIKNLSSFSKPNDLSNGYEDFEEATSLGKFLFFSKEISPVGKSCSSCHNPSLAFTDTLKTHSKEIRRNTPSIINLAFNRWFFWDGRSDSPWSQATEPIQNELEMKSSKSIIARFIYSDPIAKKLYVKIFGHLPSASDSIASYDEIFINACKSIAAFESTLISKNSKFDRFAKDVVENGSSTIFSQDEYNGLKLFIGRANCITCHNGFNFTDNEFHNIKLKQDDDSLDPGRYNGVELLKNNNYNRLSKFSKNKKNAIVEFIVREPKNWGEFKTPSLRNVALTHPYMHDGRFNSLNRVLHYYSTLEGSQKGDHHSETILLPLHLTAKEQTEIISFLNALTDTTGINFTRKKYSEKLD